MLAYAFRVLQGQGYRDVATEEFANTADLMAEILARGIASQLKRGLGQEYVERTEAVSALRGKIEVTDSLKTRSVLRRQMVCSFDEFSVDTRMNRILKATCRLLIGSDIDRGRKKALKRLMAYFGDVGETDLATVDWHMRFDRNNQTYRMLMNVCWLVAKGLLQTQSDGTRRLQDFLDEQRMCALYERFILEYYRREHPGIDVGAPRIPWVLDDGIDDMLPAMRSDVVLSRGGRVLIVDAKYYAHATQRQFDKHTVHSANLYQIFAYVKNKEAELSRAGAPHEVSGVLLYARTDEEIQPEGTYQMSGNRISVRTLDLDREFPYIAATLDGIARDHFGTVRGNPNAIKLR